MPRIIVALVGACAAQLPFLPPPAAYWDFSAAAAPLCDRSNRSSACLRDFDQENPVKLVRGVGAAFVRGQRLDAPRAEVPAVANISGPLAKVSVVAWIRPRGGGFVGGSK